MDVFSGHFEDMHRTVLQNCNNMQQQHSMKYTAKSAILILRKKILKTSKRLLLLCNILLVLYFCLKQEIIFLKEPQ